MNMLSEPRWLKQFQFPYKRFEEIPGHLFDYINTGLNKVQSKDPIVSVVISAWNEETNILTCIASLSKMETKRPFEIIVVNNNSTDKTQQTLDKLFIKSVFQPIQGWGPARQLGQEHAKGKYILLADADCIYSKFWIDEMMDVLEQPNTVCAYGRYSFIPDSGFPRWKLFILERMKDAIAEFRQIKRPYLNAYGINMGYVKEYGLKIGYAMYKIRGDEGRLIFDMMQYGSVRQVRASKAKCWTGPRTLQQDGSLNDALKNRILRECRRFFSLFTPHPPHDTKTSSND